MSRRAPRVDGNQAAIVRALRAAGCSVTLLHGVGDGCPDLLVGARGRTVLLEVKRSEAAAASHVDSGPRQARWRSCWRGGPILVVWSPETALAAVGVVPPSQESGPPAVRG